MTRRRSQVEVSLFPFLSVLCTVIGVLVLFIVLILSTRVVEEDERFRRVAAHNRKPKPGREHVLEQGIDPQTFAALEAELSRVQHALAAREDERLRLKRKLDGLENLLEVKKTEMEVPLTRRPTPKPLSAGTD